MCLWILKPGPLCFQHKNVAHFLVVASSPLSCELMIPLLKISQFFLSSYRLDCGLWLFPRSEQLFCISSEKLSASLPTRTEKISTKLKCSVPDLQTSQYQAVQNNSGMLYFVPEKQAQKTTVIFWAALISFLPNSPQH